MVSGRKTNLVRRQQITELSGQGLSQSEIARRVGITRQAVRRHLDAIDNSPPTLSCASCLATIISAGALKRNQGKALCPACLGLSPGAPFAQRLVSLRLARGLTIMQLAKWSTVDPNLLHDYEEGVREPRSRIRAKLVRVLGRELDAV
jgi:transcriptional regulator with XRE-family HTH domain